MSLIQRLNEEKSSDMVCLYEMWSQNGIMYFILEWRDPSLQFRPLFSDPLLVCQWLLACHLQVVVYFLSARSECTAVATQKTLLVYARRVITLQYKMQMAQGVNSKVIIIFLQLRWPEKKAPGRFSLKGRAEIQLQHKKSSLIAWHTKVSFQSVSLVNNIAILHE